MAYQYVSNCATRESVLTALRSFALSQGWSSPRWVPGDEADLGLSRDGAHVHLWVDPYGTGIFVQGAGGFDGDAPQAPFSTLSLLDDYQNAYRPFPDPLLPAAVHFVDDGAMVAMVLINTNGCSWIFAAGQAEKTGSYTGGACVLADAAEAVYAYMFYGCHLRVDAPDRWINAPFLSRPPIVTNPFSATPVLWPLQATNDETPPRLLARLPLVRLMDGQSLLSGQTLTIGPTQWLAALSPHDAPTRVGLAVRTA